MRRLLAAGLAASTLSACGAGSRPEVPSTAAIVAPQQWRDIVPGRPIDEQWWQAFGDPALDTLVQSALDRNMDIAIAARRVIEARAQLALADSQTRPTLGASVSEVRERSVSPFGKPEKQTAAQPLLSVAYELDLFGQLANESAAARAALLASQASQENVRLAIISATVAGYVGLRASDARLALLRDTLKARAEELHIARRQAETGYASQLALRQAEAEYRATEQLIAPTQLAIARQENAISILLGENPNGVERGAPLDRLALPPIPDRLPSDLLRRRPDILAAEQQLVAADRSLDAARAAFMPKVELAGDAGFALSTLLADPITIFSIGGSILAPLFDGGRLQAEADIATAQRDQAAFAYRRSVLVAFQEVEDARAAVALLADQESALTAQRDVLARAFVLASKRYRAGYASYLEQLDAQRNLLLAELGIVDVRSDRLRAVLQLYRAVGGAWPGLAGAAHPDVRPGG